MFVIGEVVKLKSGGPEMTVGEVCRNIIVCNWFYEGCFNHHTFLQDELEPVKELPAAKTANLARPMKGDVPRVGGLFWAELFTSAQTTTLALVEVRGEPPCQTVLEHQISRPGRLPQVGEMPQPREIDHHRVQFLERIKPTP